MGKYSKNFLPILFNIYTTEKLLEKDPLRQIVYVVIQLYLKMTDNGSVNEFLSRAIEKYKATSDNSEETNYFTKFSLLDLITLMIAYSNKENLEIVYQISISRTSVITVLRLNSLNKNAFKKFKKKGFLR